ncbi:MAG TPA: hypothetical protein GX499_00660 [Clostridiales bacterium]|nr:hypothetical protein [Clostridiales bacterium]
MTPCELNAILAAITNYLYVNLSPHDFKCLSVFLSLLSKQMFTLVALKEICNRNEDIVVAADVD